MRETVKDNSRVLKFRAWDEINKKFHYSDEYDLVEDFWMMVRQHHWVLQQDTGLKDKNGKKIYEGDILRGIKWGFLSIVEWGIIKVHSPTANIKLHPDGEIGVGWGYRINEDGPHRVEVVGNIFENPEILEEISKE